MSCSISPDGPSGVEVVDGSGGTVGGAVVVVVWVTTVVVASVVSVVGAMLTGGAVVVGATVVVGAVVGAAVVGGAEVGLCGRSRSQTVERVGDAGKQGESIGIGRHNLAPEIGGRIGRNGRGRGR